MLSRSASSGIVRLAAVGLGGAIGALIVPGGAAACTRCIGSSGESVLSAYLWTAAVLSVLPLGIAGTLVFALRRQFRRHGSTVPPPEAGGPHARS